MQFFEKQKIPFLHRTSKFGEQLLIVNTLEQQRSNDERIADRMANHHELRLMATLPEVNARFKCTTIIIHQGVYQLDEEINDFKCIIRADEFTSILHESTFLQDAAVVTDPEGIFIYNKLTLKQLNLLEAAIQKKRGHTLIGYAINEEIFLRIINYIMLLLCRSTSEYPPLPEARSKNLLTFINKPIIFDISASLRVSAQTYLLFAYIERTYSQYNQENNDDDRFFVDNNRWILLSLCGFAALTMTLLRSGIIDKNVSITAIIRIRIIEQLMIAFGFNLTNYGSLILNDSIIKKAFIPILFLAGVYGYFKKNKSVINIAEFTTFQFLLHCFLTALTVGSFFSLGLKWLIYSSFFLYTENNSSTNAEYLQDISIVRYFFLSIMFCVSLLRYPYAPLEYNNIGLYAGNVINGVSIALLDNYALYLFISTFFISFYGQNFSSKEPVAPAFYCILEAFSLLAVLLITFPTTINLPEYSLEKKPINPSFSNKVFRYIRENFLEKIKKDDTSCRESELPLENLSNSSSSFYQLSGSGEKSRIDACTVQARV